LRGKDKESARQKAIATFPAAHGLFGRKKDHQRAEAALIALTPVPGVLPRAVLVESTTIQKEAV
jgi:hypothetical protein